MSKINILFIKICATKIGFDKFGNEYYESKSRMSCGNKKRYVIYNGEAEPSKVPPMWHAWLRNLSDQIPEITNFPWQQEHKPNMTGTKFAYKPIPTGDTRNIVSADYISWHPK